MRKLGRITRSKSYKIHVSLCEGWPTFLACERIAPVEARGACQASTHFHNTDKGTENNSNLIDIIVSLVVRGFRKAFMVLRIEDVALRSCTYLINT